MNRYVVLAYTEKQLLDELRDVTAALKGGSQTVAGMQPGVRHEFAEKSDKELRAIELEIMAALNVLDPDTYPNPAKRMKISTVYV